MTGKQPRDMSASVRARLMNIAKLNNEAFDLVMVRFAIEKLLYRLSQSKYRDLFVVKGAMMFQVWSNLNHRPTRDLDLLGTGEPDVECFVEMFREVCVQEVECDGLMLCFQILIIASYGKPRLELRNDDVCELRARAASTFGVVRLC